MALSYGKQMERNCFSERCKSWVNGSYPLTLYSFNSRLFFVAYNDDGEYNDKLFFTLNDTLWQSDDPREGTHRVTDENLEGVRNIYGLAVVNDHLYFSGYSFATGQELYI